MTSLRSSVYFRIFFVCPTFCAKWYLAKTVTMASDGFQARKVGWLSKRGGRIHTWHKRWFVLTGDLMFYYKTPQVS